MTHPTSGDARVFGLAADAADAGVEIRRRVGFVSDEKDAPSYMTVAEMIRFAASCFPRWRRDREELYLRALELPPTRKSEGVVAADARHPGGGKLPGFWHCRQS